MDKFASVLESASLNEHETAEYCRRKGTHPHQLEQWRKACEDANDWDRQANIKLKSEQQIHRKRKKDLEKKSSKGKSVSEAAALLVLQKKYRRSGGTLRTNDQNR